MSEHYDFHYQPTGSGAISGQQVLEQTEDAINELGDYVNDNVGGAMDVAQQALETAQNAETNAQTALDTANSFSSAIQSAQQDASTALSTAQTAQTTASNANNTAIQAQQDASTAVTTANNASGQVSTLSGTVTTLGQRVTTAEGNIGQNTSDISSLTTRVGTAEGNITTLQNDVSVAMGNASSAMATVGTVKQQAFVFRYSSTALVASSTNSNTLLDNTDNLKVGDKVIDSDGVLFSITAIDTANSTFTVGSALVDLALDGDVVHTSGDETVGGNKTFSSDITLQGTTTPIIKTISNIVQDSSAYNGSVVSWVIRDKDNLNNILESALYKYSSKSIDWQLKLTGIDNGVSNTKGIRFTLDPVNDVANFIPIGNNSTSLGTSSTKWKEVYATNYYYGSNNVEFSTKFVTSDTNQTVSGQKVFTSTPYIYNYDSTANTPSIFLRNSKVTKGGSDTGNQGIFFTDKDNKTLSRLFADNVSDGTTSFNVRVSTLDSNNADVSAEVYLSVAKTGTKVLQSAVDNDISLGKTSNRWKDTCTCLINGLTPSSLSMPNFANRVDITGYISNLSGSTNNYTPTVNGWLYVGSNDASYLALFDTGSGDCGIRFSDGVVGEKYACIPCQAGRTLGVKITCTSLNHAYFVPCQGNV